jgi:hypothetical protein
MELANARRRAAELSGGTSPDIVKNLVISCLTTARASGSLLDYGAGRGELLRRLLDLWASSNHWRALTFLIVLMSSTKLLIGSLAT